MINETNSITSKPNIPAKKANVEKSHAEDIKKSDSLKSNRKYDNIEINKLIAENEKRISDFKETIRRMIAKQGELSNLTLFGQRLNVTEEDSQKAAAAIAEGGEYSVDAVATRIMDMAKALSNGDKTKISLRMQLLKVLKPQDWSLTVVQVCRKYAAILTTK